MKLVLAMLVLSSASAFAGKITVEGLPVVKTQIKSSLYVPAGVTSDSIEKESKIRKRQLRNLKFTSSPRSEEKSSETDSVSKLMLARLIRIRAEEKVGPWMSVQFHFFN
jgi:hypothetical protein